MDLQEAQAEVDTMMATAMNADDALASVIEIGQVIPDMDGLCKPKVVLLTHPLCIPCKDLKKLHAADLASGAIKELDIRAGEGNAIATKNGIDATPALLVLDCNDNLIGEVYRDEELEAL